MISVIIPTLNEEKSIRQVISIVRASSRLPEIIVVDDNSSDRTVALATQSGAKVIQSSKLGKGRSMWDGLRIATGSIVVYVDADITTYPLDLVDRLVQPIVDDEADFVKATFSRQAGRVTELLAKPLLKLLATDFPQLDQPLAGMIAARTELLRACVFEEDYGVDVGLLIDAHRQGARISEVQIGHIENRMRSLDQLGRMSYEVANAILSRYGYPREKNNGLAKRKSTTHGPLKNTVPVAQKIAFFDIDGTITRSSYIYEAAVRFGFQSQLEHIAYSEENPIVRTKRIATLLRGRTRDELTGILRGIPMTDGWDEMVSYLHADGYAVCLVTDSYAFIADHYSRVHGCDAYFAHDLEFVDGMCTGEVRIPSVYMASERSTCRHSYCKSNLLHHVMRVSDMQHKDMIFIGDGENDVCSLRMAGSGIAFCPTSPLLKSVADHVIQIPDFSLVVDYLRLRQLAS